MIPLALSAFALGLLFNAMPGAVFAESLQRGLRGGFLAAFEVLIGSLIGDFVWALSGLLGAAVLFQLPYVRTPLTLFGAGLLFWIAWGAMRNGLSPMPQGRVERTAVDRRSAFSTGIALSLSSPTSITYWAGLGSTVSALGVAHPGRAAFAVFLAAFMTASLLWCFVCAGAIASLRLVVRPWLWRTLNLCCAGGLSIFALRLVIEVWN